MNLQRFASKLAGKPELQAAWKQVTLTAFTLIAIKTDWARGAASLDDVDVARTDFALAKTNLATLIYENRLSMPKFCEWDILRLHEGMAA